MCIQAPESWILNPPPTSHPISSLWIIPMHQPQASCIEHRLVIRFLPDSIHVSMSFSQIILHSPSPIESKSPFYMIFNTNDVKLLQSCPTLCESMDCSLPGTSVHEILEARKLEWVAMPFSRGSSQSRDWTHISYVSCLGRHFFLPLMLTGRIHGNNDPKIGVGKIRKQMCKNFRDQLKLNMLNF